MGAALSAQALTTEVVVHLELMAGTVTEKGWKAVDPVSGAIWRRTPFATVALSSPFSSQFPIPFHLLQGSLRRTSVAHKQLGCQAMFFRAWGL